MPTPAEIVDQAVQAEAEGRLVEAEEMYRALLAETPDLVAALNGLAGIAFKTGHLRPAADLLRQAIGLSPSDATLRNNAVMVLSALLNQIAANPDPTELAEIHAHLGMTLMGDPDRQEEAIRHMEAARDMGSTDVLLFNRMGNLYCEAGRFEESLAAYRRALEIAPDAVSIFSNLLVTVAFMGFMTPTQVFEEHRKFGELYEPWFRDRLRPHANVRDLERRLRIGYLSPKFCRHILMMNMIPLLREHDRDKVSVHVFAHAPRPDEVTRQAQDLADEFVFIQDMSDDDVAELIRERQIDILVHPMGHWEENRLIVFAQKPAPIQINYTCNSPTTGLTTVDYMFVDPWLDFDNRMHQFSVEKLYRLKTGFLVTEYTSEPEITPPPFTTNGGRITFGCFNNPSKLSDETLALWSRVLAAVPESDLLIKGGKIDRPWFADFLRERAARFGIDPGRLRLMGHVKSAEDHMLAHNLVDIFLDPLPFGGGRTTEDAIWMGCPVISMVGEGLHSRNTSNRHHRIGTPELITYSEDEYVAACAALAADKDRISFYRSNLRQMMRDSSLMDFKAHAADLEEAYRDMWRKWCADLPAEPGGTA